MRNKLRVIPGVCSAVLACSGAVSAQRVARSVALDTTSRVRFLAPTVVSTREPVVGKVVQVNDTAMLVRWDRAPQDEPLLVPFRSLASLDVSRGWVSAAEGRRRGFRTGVFAGVFLGMVGGYAYAGHKHFNEGLTPHGEALRAWGYGVAAGAVLGGAVGALVGTHGYERWKHVARPRSVRCTAGCGRPAA